LPTLEQSFYTKTHEEDPSIKVVSMIDSKPIYPSYISLIPLKNFSQKEQEAIRKGGQLAGQEGDGLSSINWNKLLHDDLGDMIG